MMFIRFLGMTLILCAVIALVSAISDPRSARRPAMLAAAMTSASTTWETQAPTSFAASRKALVAKVGLTAADQVVLAPLKLPLWGLLAILGVALVYLGRRRRRIKIFTN